MSGSRKVEYIAWSMVAVAAGVLAFLWLNRPEPPPERAPDTVELSAEAKQYLRTAETLLRQRSYREARKVANAALGVESNLPRALLIAADASVELDETDAALDYYGRVTDSEGMQYWVRAQTGIALVHFDSGNYADAETVLRELLARRPTDVTANGLLAEILNVEGRRWASVPHAIELVRQGRAGLETLLLLADPTYIITHTQRAEEALKRAPDDVGPVFGLARAALEEGDQEEGLKLLESVLQKQPDWVEPHVVMGNHLVNNAPDRFPEWHAGLPASAETHPGIWLLRAKWFRRAGRTDAAGRCFWETLSRNPNDQQAHFQLASVLEAQGRSQEAKAFVDRGLQLERLQTALKDIIAGGDQSAPDLIMDVAVVLEALGRGFEARNWEVEAEKRRNGTSSFQVTRPAAANTREVLALWVRPDSNPALFVDLSDVPLPKIEPLTTDPTRPSASDSPYTTRFENQAADVGVDFTYVAAPDESTEGKRVIELTGGGTGAIDFDLDSYPDILLTQGGLWPAPETATHTDKLYRNLNGQQFADVTQLAGVANTGYGQGMAAGDIDADGFADLYVGNLGQNRMYRNNGDGTFSEATKSLSDEHHDWTTSVALADLNGDGLPDIYVTNYLIDDNNFSEICRPQPDAPARICTPDQFEAAQDRVYLNLGDGRFEDHTRIAGIEVPQGKGLGLVAADFLGLGSLQLFVANDGVPNFFFERTQGDDEFRLEESATRIGLAMNAEGRAQACMGVAAGDANADGALDLFVTNFDRESNTLYVGADGLFEDVSRTASLRDPSFRLLGFGTQFIDGELDGEPDLVLTNGHVDDFTHADASYRMRPQYLRNLGDGSFTELFSDDVGPFFEIEQLGRGLCRLDWNRDGRPDVLISHLDTTAALLTNTSPATGHYLKIRLVGTSGDRDAVGAVVRVTDGQWTRIQQRVAGDGYQCSNENVLVFGLADRDILPTMEVRWLDGSTSTFSNVRANQSVVILKGDRNLYAQPR